jgi:hypothetical protein
MSLFLISFCCPILSNMKGYRTKVKAGYIGWVLAEPLLHEIFLDVSFDEAGVAPKGGPDLRGQAGFFFFGGGDVRVRRGSGILPIRLSRKL